MMWVVILVIIIDTIVLQIKVVGQTVTKMDKMLRDSDIKLILYILLFGIYILLFEFSKGKQIVEICKQNSS